MDQQIRNEDGSRPSIAIIGMALRCPGAKNVAEFWSNLRNGVESITFFKEEELRAAGVPEAWLQLPTYIKAAAPLEGIQLFDAEFFNYSAREAEFIDPQQRVFLECAYEALEIAGIDPRRYEGSIGVFAGEGPTTYMNMIFRDQSARVGIARQMALIGNDKDYLATRASYKLGLRGPSMTVQSACSTSTVAVHLAFQSLLSRECDVALAGAISLTWLQKAGYHFTEGGILAKDGHTRPFDADASGTVFSDGVAIVVLKRTEDALADSDNIEAIITGSAVNNDGSMKVGFTAPSVDAQSAVIAEAMTVAGVSPDSIGFIEAHGTGTALGDPIEVEALQQVFGVATDAKQFCALGSLKSNIGHLNTVSGVAGLIKAALSVKAGEIPPNLNFNKPNPKIDFANSPFFVPTKLTTWPGKAPRRAGVSSFGIGGTNTHIIVEEPPPVDSEETARSMHVALVSAKSPTALDASCARISEHLRAHPDENIADICHTLATGRSIHPFARLAVCTNTQEAADALSANGSGMVVDGQRAAGGQPVTFLFPGQGSQHVQMGRELYNEEPAFRYEIDSCADLLKPRLGLDLRTLLFPALEAEKHTEETLRNTQFAQPAIFAISYALAKLWMSLGIYPAASLGHSIGEFVSACIAEVLSLEDALQAVAARGHLMASMPAGSMLAVMAAAQRVEPLLPSSVSIAAINSPLACVASGPTEDISVLEKRLAEQGMSSTPLHTSHAFHSEMMQGALAPFIDIMRSISLSPPQLPYISNITGEWITDEQATDPAYWGQHLRAPVQFHKGLATIHDQLPGIFLEVGPGCNLTTLARSLFGDVATSCIQSSLPHASARGAGEVKTMLRTCAELWLAGAPIDWSRRYQGERRIKRVLPTYPFERRRYWIVDHQRPAAPQPAVPMRRGGGPRALNYLMETVSWRRVQYSGLTAHRTGRFESHWLVFNPTQAIDRRITAALRARGGKVFMVEKGAQFKILGNGRFTLDPTREADLEEICARVVKPLSKRQQLQVVYFCEPTAELKPELVEARYRSEVDDKLNIPIMLMRSLLRFGKPENVTITFITREGQEIAGTETINPAMAMPVGPCLAGMREYPKLHCRIVDIPTGAPNVEELARRVAADLPDPAPTMVTAYRGNSRWARAINPIPPDFIKNPRGALRRQGVYLITGGLGDLGLAISRHLARAYRASVILISRTPVPPRAEWSAILKEGNEEDRVVRMIRGIARIESAGGKVMVGTADVTNLKQMRAVLREALAKFGTINGVIHAAGISGSTPIGLKTAQELDEVLRPKILGLAVLEQVFAKHDLDFLALFSSVAALWGREGQVDYAAANAYLDAYAVRTWGKSRWPVISINWDTWREVGMAINTLRVPPGQAKPRVLKFGLSTVEGIRAFKQALVARHPQVIPRKPAAAAARPPQQRPGATQAMPAAAVAQAAPARRTHPRPALPQAYRAPETELQTALVAMWVDFLRTSPIGLDDNFFELGGHSLMALQLLPRIREKYQIPLEPREFFAHATIGKIAALIEEKLVTEIEEMSKPNETLAAEASRTAAE
jgi:phthiocerol/phenolphthiocerol synthesis type-I polyketide synthase E